jgi:hypothetical protein
MSEIEYMSDFVFDRVKGGKAVFKVSPYMAKERGARAHNFSATADELAERITEAKAALSENNKAVGKANIRQGKPTETEYVSELLTFCRRPFIEGNLLELLKAHTALKIHPA